MAVFFALLSVVLALLALLLFCRVRLSVWPIPDRRNFYKLEIRLARILLYRAIFYVKMKHDIRLVVIKVKRHGFKVEYRFAVNERRKHRKNPIGKAIFKTMRIELLRLDLSVGTGDAAQTALLCGILETVFFTILKSIPRTSGVGEVHVLPDFENERFLLVIRGIISLRIADIIYRFLKERGGEKNAPNRKHSEHNHVRT